MTQRFNIHPTHPQARAISQVVEYLRDGGVIVYPTDSGYALGCAIGNKTGLERIRQIRQLDKHHNFTLVCRDLSELSAFARVDNPIFRLLKSHTPGPYTFILTATKEVPKRLQHPKRRTIGLRVPNHPVVQAILEELAQPLMSVSLLFPEEEFIMFDEESVYERLAGQVDAFIYAGPCSLEPTSIVDLTEASARIVRQGQGDVAAFV